MNVSTYNLACEIMAKVTSHKWSVENVCEAIDKNSSGVTVSSVNDGIDIQSRRELENAKDTIRRLNDEIAMRDRCATIEADTKPQEPSEDLAESVCLLTRIGKDLHGNPCVILNADGLSDLIAAHDEAIRRECAKAARNAIFDFGIGDKASNYYSPMIRKELAVQLVERAILGAEPVQVMRDLDPKAADCVQKNFSELIKPAREES